MDINLPIDKESKSVVINPRIRKHGETIKNLSERGAKLIVLGHQGRKGDEDFLSLNSHGKLLEEITGKSITFLGIENMNKVREEVKRMKEGGIILLENVRFVDAETKNPFEADFVNELAPLCDYFVLDALSVAHRAHASVVGFSKHENIESFVGNVLGGEIEALQKLEKSKSAVFVIGGSKVKESIEIMEKWLKEENAEKILLGGAPATLFLKVKLGKIGTENEKFLEESEAIPLEARAKELFSKYSNKIEIPSDVVVEKQGKAIELQATSAYEGAIKDIGHNTVEKYVAILLKAKTIVMNGPVGVYEVPEFENGTKKILEAIAMSKGFSVLGGGHTTGAIEKFEIREDNFGYISLSGKAFLAHLSGKELPGLVALKRK